MKLRLRLVNLGRSLGGLLLPPRCGLCRAFLDPERPGPGICPRCLEEAAFGTSQLCPRCGGPSDRSPRGQRLCPSCRLTPPPFTKAAAVGPFQDPLAEAIKELKYNRRVELAIPLGRLLAGLLPADGWPDRFDLILPVPLHPSRIRERGFNQAALLAARLTGRGPLVKNLLLRTRPTRPQVELDGRARRINVAGAFALENPGRVRGRTVLLVDDVVTSGATVGECARILRRAGARGIYILTIARGMGH